MDIVDRIVDEQARATLKGEMNKDMVLALLRGIQSALDAEGGVWGVRHLYNTNGSDGVNVHIEVSHDDGSTTTVFPYSLFCRRS